MPDSLQDRLAPKSICFGCGPANERGLRIKSYPEDGGLVCTWIPEAHHRAFRNVVNGGILGALLDCHSNWTAAWHFMKQRGATELPATVTADFHVTLRRPTPADGPLQLRARVSQSDGDRAIVDADIHAAGKLTATCRGTFAAVTEGHPAYHRWGEDE